MATMTAEIMTTAITILLDPPGRLIDTEGLQAAVQKAEGNGRPVKCPVTITREASGVVVRGRISTVNSIKAAFLDPQSNLVRFYVRPIPTCAAPKAARVAPTPQRRKIRLED